MPKLRIERIIEVKERIMDDKRKEMEAVIAEIEGITNNISEIDGNVDINYNKLTATIMNSNDIYVLKEYIMHLENKKLEMIDQRENLKVKVNIFKAELLEMIKEIRMLEILKSKELQSIKKSQNRREQKMLDELASRIDENK
jgi:flagellar export protein FliJ